MRSFIFCTSYINNHSEEYHFHRYEKWIDYYLPLLDEMKAECLFIIDDASMDLPPNDSGRRDIILLKDGLPDRLRSKVNLVSFESHLGRLQEDTYPGWWRSFTYSAIIAERYGFDKIIHIESDFYILSSRLREFIAEFKVGWGTLYSQFCKFPEAAVQIIAKDSFPELKNYHVSLQPAYRSSRIAEKILPFTAVNKDFIGDRIGHYVVLKSYMDRIVDLPEIDYIGQLPAFLKALSCLELKELIRSFKAIIGTNDTENVSRLEELLRSRNLLLNGDFQYSV